MKPWLFLHHRAASTWTKAFVAEYTQKALGYDSGGQMNNFRAEPSDDAVRAALTHPWCIGVNAWPSLPAQLDQLVPWSKWKAVHVVRDPRDVLVSAYFSGRDYHPTTDWPELAPFKAWLGRVDQEAGIIATMGWVSFALESLAGWEARPYVLEIHYEELFASERHRPGQHYANLLAMLNWLFPPVDDAVVRELIHQHSWETWTGGRKRGVEDTSHHYRRGIAGDWERHWTKRIDEVWKEAYP